MKKILAFFIAVAIAVPTFSQINLGIKAGAATTTTPVYDLASGTYAIEALKDAGWGFQAGVFLRLSLLGIYLQPEVVFASNSYEYNVTEDAVTDIVKQTFNRLDIPVLLGFKLGPLRINAGPAAAIQIGTPKALVEDPSFEDLYKSATFGYQAGIGIDLFKKLTIDARYGGSLSEKFGDAISIGGQSFALDQRQPSVILSVGIMF